MFFVTTGKATVAFTGVRIAGQDVRVRFGCDMQKYMATIDVASSAECVAWPIQLQLLYSR